MDCVTKKINAKINLSLDITGVSGNYHTLDMVVASVDIVDVISAYKSDGLRVKFSDKTVISDKSNAYKVAKFMIKEFGLCGAEIEIKNSIPTGCGLGGSSADAAGVILALDSLFSLNLSDSEKESIAANFGSDTAYMIKGGYARLKGRGDEIERFSSSFSPDILVAYKGAVNTKECFSLYDELHGDKGVRADNDLLVKKLASGDFNNLSGLFFNGLSESSKILNPYEKQIIEIFGKENCFLTGSGAGIVAFKFSDDEEKKLNCGDFQYIKTRIVRV